MTISEKVSYIKGLADGLELGDDKQSKVIKAIIDVLDDIACDVESIEEDLAELSEQIDAVDEDLAEVEDLIYEDDDFEDCDVDDYEDDLFEVTCPKCNDIIYLDSEMLEEEGIDCPNCGTALEFDFSCDCGCDDCSSCEENDD